jgi:hypothetical protein
MKTVKFARNPSIRKKDYVDKKEYVFDRKTNIVPKRKSRLLCVIFAEDRGCYFIWRKVTNKEFDFFHFKKGQYVIDNESIHITSNGCRVAFYLEGVSTPIKMSNIERETKTVEYIDLYGEKRTSTITKIKGLKFDAKILDTFANRRFADLFTRQTINNFQLILLLLCIITCALTGIGIVTSYFRV